MFEMSQQALRYRTFCIQHWRRRLQKKKKSRDCQKNRLVTVVTMCACGIYQITTDLCTFCCKVESETTIHNAQWVGEVGSSLTNLTYPLVYRKKMNGPDKTISVNWNGRGHGVYVKPQ
jgi:hypothetical protein